MTNNTENLRTLDPAILMKTIMVNGFPVLDAATDGTRTFVLCFMEENDHSPFVTWSIWRNEEGHICAEAGDYCSNLTRGLFSLKDRSGNLEGLIEAAQAMQRERVR